MKTQIELLERRTLMSGAWTTVNNDATELEVDAMAADRVGNIYAVAWPSANAMAVLKSSNGGATWNVIAQGSPSTSFNSIATDATGDVFVAASDIGTDGGRHWRVLEQAVGQSAFSVVDDVPNGNCVALATDSAGDVYAVGSITVTTA
jgi:hypothetical protein